MLVLAPTLTVEGGWLDPSDWLAVADLLAPDLDLAGVGSGLLELELSLGDKVDEELEELFLPPAGLVLAFELDFFGILNFIFSGVFFLGTTMLRGGGMERVGSLAAFFLASSSFFLPLSDWISPIFWPSKVMPADLCKSDNNLLVRWPTTDVLPEKLLALPASWFSSGMDPQA